MAKTVIISDDLAKRVEVRRQAEGLPTLDAAAEALIASGLAMDHEAHDAGRTTEELRAALAEGEASGPLELWDAEAVKAEIRRRAAERP